MEEQKGKKKHKKKVPAEGFSPLLTNLKLVHTAQIPWGTLYTELSKGHTVMEFAWADTQIVLFMSTVYDGEISSYSVLFYISTLCRRAADIIHHQVKPTSYNATGDL